MIKHKLMIKHKQETSFFFIPINLISELTNQPVKKNRLNLLNFLNKLKVF